MSTATLNIDTKNHSKPSSHPPAKQLLLVEDEKKIADWLKESFDANFEFHWAKNLNEAFTQLDTAIPEILIVDLSLPDGNGIELLKTIKQKKIKTTVFVFSVNIALKNTCLRLGAHKFFDKNYDNQKLVGTINNL